MIKLLEQNREEVRFVQNLLFTTSFWFIAAIFGIVSYNLGRTGYNPTFRWVSAGGCIFLCFFYLDFVDFAEGGMAINHDDIVGIQYALKLSNEGVYFRDQVIYQVGDFGPEGHIKSLVQFYVVAVILAVAVLLYLPGLPEDGVRAGEPSHGPPT